MWFLMFKFNLNTLHFWLSQLVVTVFKFINQMSWYVIILPKVLFSLSWDRTNKVGLGLFTELSVQKLARQRYDDLVKGLGEYLVSGSDDFTLFLWTPEKDKKSIGNLLFTLIYVFSLQMEEIQFLEDWKIPLAWTYNHKIFCVQLIILKKSFFYQQKF